MAKSLQIMIDITNRSAIRFNDFYAVITPLLFMKFPTDSEMSMIETYLRKIFSMFDVDNNDSVDSWELANLITIMCKGSVTDKVYAMFILFDKDKTGTMSLGELVCVCKSTFFGAFYQLKHLGTNKGADFTNLPTLSKVFNDVELEEISLQTATKCFKDLKVPTE